MHYSRDFKFSSFSEEAFKVSFSDGSYYKLLRRGPEMLSMGPMKKSIFDYDNVVNPHGTEPPIIRYMKNIFKLNSYIGERENDVLNYIKLMERLDDPSEPSWALEQIFIKGALKREQHLLACKLAAREFEIVPNYNSSMKEIFEMGYEPTILSASPEDLIIESRDRLGIRMCKIEATKFHFDSSGVFYKMDLNLGKSRAAKRDKIMQDSIMTPYGVEMLFDDNSLVVKNIAKLGWNHAYFVLNNAEPMKGNVSISVPELRENFESLPDLFWRSERCQGILLSIPELDYLDAIKFSNLALNLGNIAKNLSGLEFYERKKSIVENTKIYLSKIGPFFPRRETQIEVQLEELMAETDEDKAKVVLKNFMDMFPKNSFEANLSADLFK